MPTRLSGGSVSPTTSGSDGGFVNFLTSPIGGERDPDQFPTSLQVNPIQAAGLLLSNFAAGKQGRPLPTNQLLQQQQQNFLIQERLRQQEEEQKFREISFSLDSLGSIIGTAQSLPTDSVDQFLEQNASALEKINPGSANIVRALKGKNLSDIDPKAVQARLKALPQSLRAGLAEMAQVDPEGFMSITESVLSVATENAVKTEIVSVTDKEGNVLSQGPLTRPEQRNYMRKGFFVSKQGGQTININDEQESAMAGEVGTGAAELYNGIQQSGRDAVNTASNAEAIKILAKDMEFEPGSFSGLRMAVSKAANLFGFELPTIGEQGMFGGPEGAELMDKLSKNLALSFRAEGSQRTTNLLLQTFIESLPNIGDERETIIVLSDIMKRRAEIERGLAQETRALNDDPAALQAKVAEFLDNNPLLNREIKTKIVGLMGRKFGKDDARTKLFKVLEEDDSSLDGMSLEELEKMRDEMLKGEVTQ